MVLPGGPDATAKRTRRRGLAAEKLIRGRTKQIQEIHGWKLREVDHSHRTKGRMIGSQAPSGLILYSKHPIPHAWLVRASCSSRVRAPRGIHIHLVKR